MNTNEVARIATLVGEPARTAMLLALMDGRAFTARELADAGNVTPQTASKHLAQLLDAGLLSMERQGRHRYHRLASEKVAAMLEGLMQVAAVERSSPTPIFTGPKDQGLRKARMCYNHIAGRLGVAISDHLIAQRAIVLEQGSGQVTELLTPVLASLDLPLPALQLNTSAASRNTILCRPCLDWSERRYHVAGPLGQHICHHLLQRDCIRRKAHQRGLIITSSGATLLRRWLGEAGWKTVQGS